jgi:hypothetical protein
MIKAAKAAGSSRGHDCIDAVFLWLELPVSVDEIRKMMPRYENAG